MSAVAKAKIVSSRAGDIETLGPNADESVSLTATNRWALGLLVHPAGQNATDKIGDRPPQRLGDQLAPAPYNCRRTRRRMRSVKLPLMTGPRGPRQCGRPITRRGTTPAPASAHQRGRLKDRGRKTGGARPGSGSCPTDVRFLESRLSPGAYSVLAQGRAACPLLDRLQRVPPRGAVRPRD